MGTTELEGPGAFKMLSAMHPGEPNEDADLRSLADTRWNRKSGSESSTNSRCTWLEKQAGGPRRQDRDGCDDRWLQMAGLSRSDRRPP